MKQFKEPSNTKEVQRFLGLAGYFRKFIDNYATIAKPLSDLLRQKNKFEFALPQKVAFDKLKNLICERPVLSIFQYGLETEIHTDASKHALAAILMQRSNEDDNFHPVRYMSIKTSVTEENWSSYELEVYAVVRAVTEWRIYLLGSQFKVITDCKAFEDTMKKKQLPKIARWAMKLQEFDMKVIHRPGTKMQHVDALSRVCFMNIDDLSHALKKNQQNDDQIKKIIKAIESGSNVNNYELTNELLYRKIDNEKLIVVPKWSLKLFAVHMTWDISELLKCAN